MLVALRFEDKWKDKRTVDFLKHVYDTCGISKKRWYQLRYLQTLLGVYPWLILYPHPNHLIE
jgi:hypothetical protein